MDQLSLQEREGFSWVFETRQLKGDSVRHSTPEEPNAGTRESQAVTSHVSCAHCQSMWERKPLDSSPLPPMRHPPCLSPLQVASRLEVHPGAEFRAAYEEALACGAVVKLGDRPVQVRWAHNFQV